MTKIDKIVQPGWTSMGMVYCRIRYDGQRLSITGVIGPLRNGNAAGGVGQIREDLYEIRGYMNGWSIYLTEKFAEIWKSWHLNDMRAGCEHQRAEGWSDLRIDALKPINEYGKHYPGQKYESWNMLTWVTQGEYALGMLSRPCSQCGYKYGSKWLFEAVPKEVIEFLESLPQSQDTPAWV